MYIPSKYKISDFEEVKTFIHTHSFGILVNILDGKPWATHIPLELSVNDSGENVLLGHLSKGNPQWKVFAENPQVLAIFHAPHAYISSSWYNHENVPTWNYIAVHIYGHLRIIEGEELYQSLIKLVNRYEAASQKPVKLEELSPEFIQREMRGIVGFEIKIEDIHGAKKLSQNRAEEDYQIIINELNKRGDGYDATIAAAMKALRP